MGITAYINIAFQAFGGLLSLMIILFLVFIKRDKSRLDHLYIRFLACNTAVLFSNAVSWVFDGWQGNAGRWFSLAANFCMFVFSYVLLGVFTDYVAGYLEERGADCHRTVMRVWGICAVLIVSVVISQYTGWYYTIDMNNVYQRQGLFWVSQVVPGIGIFHVLWLLVCHRQRLDGREFGAFVSYLILPFAALVVQMFSYGVVYLHLATTFVAICIYIFIQAEQSRKLSEQELELERGRTAIMLSQIQPHFLYNSLLGIKQLCDTEPKRASEALEHFAYYLRGNLYSISDSRMIPFEKELEHVKDYLYLEKMRFEDRLTVRLEILFTDFLLPPLTLQPIVENAVRHGITKKEEGGTLTIRCEVEAGDVIITVTDDGIGFNPLVQPDDSRPHIGIENVRQRLETLCGGYLQIQSAADKGTRVRIILPEGNEDENHIRRC